jgi:hypothetical protein
VSERERRLGINEGVFREVNERLEELAAKTGFSEWGPLDLVCECGDTSCSERIEMSREDYEAVRSDSTRFVVVPGHEIPDVEQVVERHDGYVVVSKHEGDAAEFARKTDPRS